MTRKTAMNYLRMRSDIRRSRFVCGSRCKPKSPSVSPISTPDSSSRGSPINRTRTMPLKPQTGKRS